MTITIERLRELLEKATKGPWLKGSDYGLHSVTVVTNEGIVVGAIRDSKPSGDVDRGRAIYSPWEEGSCNAELIAALPEIAALAISEHERAEKAEAELRKQPDLLSELSAPPPNRVAIGDSVTDSADLISARAIVLPEPLLKGAWRYRDGWNDCLDEMIRLNADLLDTALEKR